MPCCSMRYTSVAAQGRKIQELSDASGAESNEPLEARKVANLVESPNVPLNVIAQCLSRFKMLIVNVRVESGVQHVVDGVTGVRALKFANRKR